MVARLVIIKLSYLKHIRLIGSAFFIYKRKLVYILLIPITSEWVFGDNLAVLFLFIVT